MIYLDNGATSFHKPPEVRRAVLEAMATCANPGRGGYGAAMRGAEKIYRCREVAGELFGCRPEQVVLTNNCTHGLNLAIHSLVKPGEKVVISGFEHNAVTRPLYALGARVTVAGRRLFDWEDTLAEFRQALEDGARVAVCTHVSNVFGYILPVEEIGRMCKEYGAALIVDAAQSAGSLEVGLEQMGADFVAMPGHKGLLGPQGTGLLLCGKQAEPLLFGGTGSNSLAKTMPEDLPDRLEAGTLNVPGYAGLTAGMEYLLRMGPGEIADRQRRQARRAAMEMKALGLRVFAGAHQLGTVSFVPKMDCEEQAQLLAQRGIGVRAGLHCAPLAHESAGTLESGTVRISFGHDAAPWQTERLIRALKV